ncbi:NAD(P)/FAD-dependent oxidoreductase [Mycolicibacterium thermoresistibile]
MTDYHAPENQQVVVIGGGYAGALAANRLQQNPDLDITLVNPRPTFVQRLRLHQLAAGTGSGPDVATADYSTLLGPRVRLVVDTATRIDTAARRIQLASGDALHYDYLIYAVGSTGTVPAAVPGAAEFAYPMAELEQAQRLRTAVDGLRPQAWITVVGAGLTGIEMAAELAEQGRRVTLVCGGRLAPSFGEPARRATAAWLTKHGVVVLESDVVTEVRRDAVVFADGAVRPSALTIWAGGFGTPDLASRSGLRTDAAGRLLTDETLTSMDDDRIVGAGDAVTSTAQPLRMSCYTATPTAAAAADTVLSRIAGTQPARFSLAYSGACVGLGRRAATLQFSRTDDTPVRAHLRGRLIGAFKEAVTRGTLWGIRHEGRKPGSVFWRKGYPRQDVAVPEPEVVR